MSERERKIPSLSHIDIAILNILSFSYPNSTVRLLFGYAVGSTEAIAYVVICVSKCYLAMTHDDLTNVFEIIGHTYSLRSSSNNFDFDFDFKHALRLLALHDFKLHITYMFV